MHQHSIDTEIIQLLLEGEFHAPRSWLGFHEELKGKKRREWVVRVWEPSAVEVKIDWEAGPQL